MLQIRSITRAFAYRNYRLFWSGQAISLIGSWMQRVAMGWLVYRLTHSPVMLGLVEFSGQIPAFLLAPFAGVFLDRLNRHHILIVAQILLMIQALTLATLVLGGWVRIEHVIVLNIFFGLINAFDMPARQAILKDIVERKEDIGNAIALNSSMFNGARLVGPSIAGFLIALVGEGWCFLLNGITFSAVIIALVKMRVSMPDRSGWMQTRILQSVRDGLAYSYRSSPIRIILLLLTMVSLIGLPYTVLLPVFAKDIFHGDATTLGFLTSASGIGALYGAFYLARRQTVLGLERTMLVALICAGAAFVIVALLQILWLALFFITFIGFGFMVVFASGNTLLQTLVADDKRGRVLALYSMTFLGMAPVGSVLAGILTKYSSAPTALFVSGVLLLLGGLYYSRYRASMRMHILHHYQLFEKEQD